MGSASSLFQSFPHLASPAMLASATFPWFQLPPHVEYTDIHLQELATRTRLRKVFNYPYQHSKSEHISMAAPAWLLLLKPDTRVIIICHDEDLANKCGSRVKDYFQRWGPDLGLEIRKDTRGKGYWKIKGHEGGVFCQGWRGGVSGWAADLFLVDDILKNPQEAMSPGLLEEQWRFYMNVVFARLRLHTSLILVGTRWSARDIFGRVREMARRTREKWDWVVYPALAEDNDLLGRKKDEPLWPGQVPREQLEAARQEFGPWFEAGWQQRPAEESGVLFRPARWPVFDDLGNVYQVAAAGAVGRQLYGYEDVWRLVTVDWATSERRTADYTAIGVFGLLPDGRLLVLDMVNERLPLEKCVPKLAEVCRRWQPWFVAVESGGFQTALALECRRHGEIPEVRQVKPEGVTKLQRALQAIVWGENQRILLPSPDAYSARRMTAGSYVGQGDWRAEFCAQLTGFTGVDDGGHDDMVDVLSYAAIEANLLKGYLASARGGDVPCLLTPGRDMGGYPSDRGW